jgi:hypothetical protein
LQSFVPGVSENVPPPPTVTGLLPRQTALVLRGAGEEQDPENTGV